MRKYLLITLLTAGSSVLLYTSLNSQSVVSGNHGKVSICHCPPGNPDNCHTIIISPNAVNAHLKHGDAVGPCTANEEPGEFTGY